MKRVYADVEDKLFTDFKVRLAQEGKCMAPVIRKMIEKYITEGEKVK